MDVPKIIWQTHNYEFNELPHYLKKVTQNWKNLNPGWDYRYASHTQRLKEVERYPELLNFYLQQTPTTQSDIWRFIVTYEHGGVYADMDSVCVKPLDYLLQGIRDCEMLVVPSDHNPGLLTNTANYAIKAQSPIMANVLKYGQDNIGKIEHIQIKHPWYWFIDEVTKPTNDVCYEFTSAWHTADFKSFFRPDFPIDDYGTTMPYDSFLKKYNLSMI
jgi:hypothetical protein